VTPVLFALPGNEATTRRIADASGIEMGALEVRQFPDGETYLRYPQSVASRTVILVCTLDRPDGKFLPLFFAASAARELKAARVGFVAPYLAYMRQDRSFHPGEAVTSSIFARLLSANIDWLVAIDPHLHRIHALEEVYTVPSRVIHTAPLISSWIKAHVKRPLLIGPDAESSQWVEAVARDAGAPFVVLQKTRRGDRSISVSVPEVERWRGFTPVLVDDIVSTGRTMIETIHHLKNTGLSAPVCIAVHPIFSGNALRELREAGAAQIVSTNTIAHETNAIDVTALLVPVIQKFSRL
jgi:ribose-phosphate pyrophosphokinase